MYALIKIAIGLLISLYLISYALNGYFFHVFIGLNLGLLFIYLIEKHKAGNPDYEKECLRETKLRNELNQSFYK